MKFKIDKRYIAIQSLKAIVGYILGVFIVFNLLDLKTPKDFVGTSLFAGIILYFVFVFPKSILIKDGIISFVVKNCVQRTKINLLDITKVECSCKYYNSMVIKTKFGDNYKLHPKNAQRLEEIISSYKRYN